MSFLYRYRPRAGGTLGVCVAWSVILLMVYPSQGVEPTDYDKLDSARRFNIPSDHTINDINDAQWAKLRQTYPKTHWIAVYTTASSMKHPDMKHLGGLRQQLLLLTKDICRWVAIRCDRRDGGTRKLCASVRHLNFPKMGPLVGVWSAKSTKTVKYKPDRLAFGSGTYGPFVNDFVLEHAYSGKRFAVDDATASRTSFEHAIHPITLTEYRSEYFEKKPLLVRHKDPDYFAHLQPQEDLETFFEMARVYHEEDGPANSTDDWLRNVQNGDSSDRTFAGDTMFQHYLDGKTMVLNKIGYFWPAAADLCNLWSKELKMPIHINTYITPRAAQGFAPHADGHDVWVVQIYGRKKWRVYDSKRQVPLPQQDQALPNVTINSEVEPGWEGKLYMEVVLEAGDILYLPRGWVHEAFCIDDEPSQHWSCSVANEHTWGEFIEQTLTHDKAMATSKPFVHVLETSAFPVLKQRLLRFWDHRLRYTVPAPLISMTRSTELQLAYEQQIQVYRSMWLDVIPENDKARVAKDFDSLFHAMSQADVRPGLVWYLGMLTIWRGDHLRVMRIRPKLTRCRSVSSSYTVNPKVRSSSPISALAPSGSPSDGTKGSAALQLTSNITDGSWFQLHPVAGDNDIQMMKTSYRQVVKDQLSWILHQGSSFTIADIPNSANTLLEMIALVRTLAKNKVLKETPAPGCDTMLSSY